MIIILSIAVIMLILLTLLQEFEARKLRKEYEITNNNLMELAKGLHKKGIITLIVEGEKDEF